MTVVKRGTIVTMGSVAEKMCASPGNQAQEPAEVEVEVEVEAA